MDQLRTLLQNAMTDAGISTLLAAFLISLVVVVLWIIIGKVVSQIGRRSIFHYFSKKKGDQRGTTLASLLNAAFKVVVWFVIIMAIVSELGFNITPILAAAGILGLAIGFGAQNLVRDVIAGFFMIVDNVYNIGETVEIGGFRGTVQNMNLRNTTLKNFMGSELIVNHGNVSQVINWSRHDNIALVNFGVAYETDLSKLSQIMPRFMKKLNSTYEEILEEPLFLGVTDLGDSSINMRIMATVTTGNHWAIERKIRKDLVEFLNEHDIEIPFPQLVVANKAIQ